MSLEDLQRAGMLLPRQQWGKHQLHTTVSKPWLVTLGVIALASAALMYWGNGRFYTWIGVGMFLLSLLGFTLLSLRAVERQRQESRRKGYRG